MRVVVTRPAAEGRAWAQALREAGFDAAALPLIAIAPLAGTDRAALGACWHGLAEYRAVMFVSAAAVQHFFAAAPAGRHWPDACRAWSPGPGTSAVLRSCGVAATAIDAPAADAAQLDSEALWEAAGHRIAPGDRVLIVRGARQAPDETPDDGPGTGHGRAWMAERLARAGAGVTTLAAYRRGAPAWSAAEAARAATWAGPDTVWLFSNSEAVGHLFALLPPHAAALRGGVALATHPRIAAAAKAAGFARTEVARPGMAGVLEALRGLDRSIESTG